MRRAFRRAGLALLAAGALGITPAASAQRWPVPAGFSQTGIEATAPVIVAEGEGQGTSLEDHEHLLALNAEMAQLADPLTYEGHDRLLALKAELALLADPITFPCRISIEVTGDSLTLKGFVLNETVRRRALQIVQLATGFAPNDNLQLHSLVLPATGISEGELQTHVVGLLANEYPERGRFFGVRIGAHGQVILTGMILSYEEKAAVSRCMRKVEGCQSVVNKLQVPVMLRKGHLVALLSADGQQAVAAEALGEDAPPRLPAFNPEEKQKSLGHVVALGPNVEPLPAAPAKQKAMKVAPASHSLWPQAVQPGSKEDTPAWAPPADMVPPREKGPKSPFRSPPAAHKAMPTDPILPLDPAPYSEVQPTKPMPAFTARNQQAPSNPGIAEPRPIASAPSVPAALPGSTWAQAKSQTGPGSDSEKVVNAGDPWQASTAADAAPAKPGAPYVTTGVVTFDDDDMDGTPGADMVPGSLQERLKKRIESASDGKAPDVEVIVRSPRSVLIRLRVLSKADAEPLSRKVLALAELGPFQVDLEVRLAHR